METSKIELKERIKVLIVHKINNNNYFEIFSDPNLNCPDEWFASGKHCYQLSLSETKTIDEAKKMCSQLKPGNENELPTFDDENDWHDMLGFLYGNRIRMQNSISELLIVVSDYTSPRASNKMK